MFEKILQVLSLNGIKYEKGHERVVFKLDCLSARITIRYHYETQSYQYDFGEFRMYLSSLLMFMVAFFSFNEPNQHEMKSFVFFCLVTVGVGYLILIFKTYIQLLDLKSQLREVGVYLNANS